MQRILTALAENSIYGLGGTVFNSRSAYLPSADDTLASVHFCKLFGSIKSKIPTVPGAIGNAEAAIPTRRSHPGDALQPGIALQAVTPARLQSFLSLQSFSVVR